MLESKRNPKSDYTSNVYNALKSKVEGFNKTEDEFRQNLSDPNYVKNVHNALSEKIGGFSKTADEFANLILPKAKDNTFDTLNPVDAIIKQQSENGSLKKKEEPTSISTTPTESMASAQTSGSSDGIDTKLPFGKIDAFGGKSPTEAIIDTQQKTVVNQETPENKQKRLSKELSSIKVTTENMDEVSKKTDELVLLQKQQKQIQQNKQNQIVKSVEPLIARANTITDEDKSTQESDFDNDWNKTGFTNKLKQFGLSALSGATNLMNKSGFIDESLSKSLS